MTWWLKPLAIYGVGMLAGFLVGVWLTKRAFDEAGPPLRPLVMALALLLTAFASGQASAATWDVEIDPRLPKDRVLLTLDAWEKVADVHWVERKSECALRIQLGTIKPEDYGLPSAPYSGLYDPDTNTITLANPEPFAVSQVLMHELGHFLGLYPGSQATHCPNPCCVMYYQTSHHRRVCSRCVGQVIRRFGKGCDCGLSTNSSNRCSARK